MSGALHERSPGRWAQAVMPDLPNLGLARSEAEGATPQVVCDTMREHNACTPKCHPSRCPPAAATVYVPASAGDREAESPIEQEGEPDPWFVAEDPLVLSP
jgi:hypothetical protein